MDSFLPRVFSLEGASITMAKLQVHHKETSSVTPLKYK